ncbi:electron carrier/ protein disulfide oxidoreductase [Anaeramoeba flamelloides]|uniref:Electron carrier/ protein disulfide oxidoreductase n=1 Tax=Anaeramoeba flamelloides TaxID=1746091 RepID=A0AAV8A0L7_9EUKA|nr:electron carrier/ protein disulfide oxidoreductase [Anaeramoeba flamelloides]
MSKFFRKKEGKEAKEVSLGADTINEINDELTKFQTQYRKLKHKQQMVMSKDLTTNLKMKLKGAQERVRNKILEIETLKQEYNESSEELERLKKENQEDLEKKMSKKDRKAIANLKERIERHKTSIKRLEENTESIKLQEKLNEEQIELKQLSAQNNKLRIQFNKRKEEHNQLEQEIQKQTFLMSGSEKDLEELKDRLYKKNQQEIKNLKVELNKQEFELRKLRKLEESKSNVTLQQKLVRLKMQLEKKTEENKSLERQLSKFKLLNNYSDETETGLGTDHTNLSDLNTISGTESDKSMKDDQITIKSDNSIEDFTRSYQYSNDEKTKSSFGSELNDKLKVISEEEGEISDMSLSNKDSISDKQQTMTEDISDSQNIDQDVNNENKYDIKSIDVLFTIPTAVEYFKEFLCEQLNQENILFFLEVKEFKNSFQNEKKTMKASKKIYNKYIKPGSLFEVNIDYSNRQEIIELIQNKKISLDMFDQAQEIVFRHMENNSFSQFQKSKLYKKLIRKLKTDTGFKFSQTQKKAIMVSRKKVLTALNVDFKFKGNTRNCYLVSTKLMEILIAIFTSHYSISSKQIDFNQISQSIPFHRFVAATAELQKVKLQFLREEQTLPFFLNIYNILLLHAAIINGIPPDRNTLRNFLKESKYSIGGLKFSLNDIRDGILRSNKDKKANNYFKQGDPRSKYCVKKLIPKIHFSLISLTSCRSVIQTYYKEKVHQQMKNSARLQLPKMISFKKNGLILPKLFQIYSKDFGGSASKAIEWISQFLTGPKLKKIQNVDLGNIKYGEETIGVPVFLIDTMSPVKKKWGKKKHSSEQNNNDIKSNDNKDDDIEKKEN